jgi:hypothetical protein
MWPLPLPPGSATGIGSFPGLDVTVAQRQVMDLLPDFPHLVELPERGPGADMIGRTAAMLVDLTVDLQPAGWRLVDRPGLDVRRAEDMLKWDLDALGAAADGWTGPLKLQAAGPWTLAAALELSRGDKAIADVGAVADIAASLAEGLALHVARVAALIPGASITVQLDEPSLPATIAGQLPTASGFSVLRTPEPAELQERLATVLSALPSPGVHCCARQVPFALLRAAGARWVSLDLGMLNPVREDDALGEALEAGVGLILGTRADGAGVTALVRRLGIAPDQWLDNVVLAPPCGLVGQSAKQAVNSLRTVGMLAKQIAETVGESA